MPSGVFPVPKFHPTPSSVGRRPSLAARLRTRWSRDRLDHELAHGADPATSTELGLRCWRSSCGFETTSPSASGARP
jgi:hypothetical protein